MSLDFDLIFDRTLEQFDRPNYRKDPVAWSHDRLGVTMWSMQAKVVRTVASDDRVIVKSCHDSGKSFSAANLEEWWLDVHPPGRARVITTAPTGTQVKSILWNEINQLFDTAKARGNPLRGRCLTTERYIGNWQAALGRKPSDYRQDTFQGLHAEHLLIIIDEASSVPDALWDAVETLATNEGAKIFAIGNPDDPQSRMARYCRDPEKYGYTVITIPAASTPNFSGEPVPDLLRRVLLDKKWVDRRRADWGEDHPFWISKVLAEFPDVDIKTVVKITDALRCALEKDSYPQTQGVTQLGVDVAGSEAGDKTVIRERRGNLALREWSIQTDDPEAIQDKIVECQAESGATVIAIDAIGVGFGFIAGLRKALPRVAIVPVNVSKKATKTPEGAGKSEFRNLRAQIWWEARNWSRKDLWDLSLMENKDETIAELVTPRYKTEKGVITVESKDDIRKRLTGHSPDHADALLLAFHKSHAGGMAKVSSAAGRRMPTGTSIARR